MGIEQRRYEREMVNLEGVFYVRDGDDTIETVGLVSNISERGVGIEVPLDGKFAEMMKIGSVVRFQAYDEFEVLNEEENQTLDLMVTTVWTHEGDGVLQLGCAMSKPDIEISEYIDKKRTSRFYRELKEID